MTMHRDFQLRPIYSTQSTYWLGFGIWKETRKPGGNSGHWANVQHSTEMITRAQDQTERQQSYPHCSTMTPSGKTDIMHSGTFV